MASLRNNNSTNEKYRIEFGIVGINELQKYQRGLQATNNELRTLKKRIREQKTATSAQANNLTRLTAQQQLYNAKVKEGIKNLKGNASRLREYGAQTKKTTKSMAGMAAKAVAALAAFRQLSQFLVTSVKDFAAYERGVKNVTTLLSAEDKNMFSPQLYSGVIDVSKEFGFTLADVNKAMFNSVSAGVSAGNAVNFLKEASTLAIAGVTDLKSAALGLTTVINAYGMEADQARRVSEILFTTQKFGVTTVDELAKSIGVVVPFAAASGISFEELGAAISVTTRSGLDAAKTVTALRAAISQMQKPATQSIDLFTKWGIPIGAAEMKTIGFTETMRRLNEVYKQSPRDIELMFGNVRGLTAIFSLAGDNAAEYGRFLAEMSSDTGEASSLQRALAENVDSTDIAIKKLNTSYKALKISIGDSSFMKELVEDTTSFLDILAADELSFFEKLFVGEEGKQEVLNRIKLKRKLASDRESRELIEGSIEDINNIRDKIKKGVQLSGAEEKDLQSVMDIIPSLEQEQDDGRTWWKEEDKKYRDMLAIFTDYQEKIEAETKEAEDAAQKVLDDQAKATKSWRENELTKRNEFNKKAHKSNVAFSNGEIKTAEEVKNHKLGLIDIELDYLKDILNQKGINAQQEVKFQKRMDALLLKRQQTHNGHEISEEKRKQDVIKSLKMKAMNEATSFLNQSLQVGLENKNKEFENQKENIDKEAEFGLISKRQANEEKLKIDKEAFEARKSMEKKMALISYIKELMNIRVQAAANPLNAITFGGAGISQYAILAGIATAAYAGNVSNINAQKFAKGGMVYGKSHAQGGEKFAVGGQVAELEGGEAVINKRSTAMFGSTLSAMNVAGGGTSFSSPNLGGGGLIDYAALGKAISRNTNVVLPIESLNTVQNRVSVIESNSQY